MPTFTQEVTSSANDGWGSSGAAEFWTTGASYLGAADLDASQDTGDQTWCWWRFTSVTIPKNSTVSAAYLELTATSSAQDQGHNLAVRVGPEAADNPAAPTSNGDLFGRVLTNYEEWSLPDIDPNGTYQTPDLATPLTSHFARSGWASGNALQILATYLSGELGGSGTDSGLAMEAADSAGAGEYPFLSITYTAPAGNPWHYYAQQ